MNNFARLDSNLAGQLRRGRGGFTLTEILVATAVIGVLASLVFGVFGNGRESARRSQCDTHLKALAIALDAFRQENGRFPAQLTDLVQKKYIADSTLMRCPNDPDEAGPGYAAYYVQRGVRNDPAYSRLRAVSELPTIVCPFHEADGHGAQAFAGTFTHQFAVQPAELVSANSASVKSAVKQTSLPASAGMKLHGGDRVVTGVGGMALIRFADGSTCELGGGSDVTVLQSFLSGGQSTLYSMVRQTLGDISYTVTHGSKFDVSTPTATAGALGTEFRIRISGKPGDNAYSENWINTSVSLESQVYWSKPNLITVIPRGVWVPVGSKGSTNTYPRPDPDPTAPPTPTATPVPTAKPIPTATPVPTAVPTATPVPTAVPTATPRRGKDDDDDDGNNGGGNDGRGKG